MIGGHAQNIALTRFAKRGFDVSGAIHTVRRNKAEWHSWRRSRAAIIARAIWGLVAKPTSSGTCAAFMRSGASVHSFGR